MKTNLIEKFLIKNNLKYDKFMYSLKIYDYKDKYNINIDLQFGDYVISKYLDDYYICEVECKTQNEVISLLK